MANGFNVQSNGFWINGSAPTYLVNSSYNYVSALNILNVSGRASFNPSIAITTTAFTPTALASIKIYGTTGWISSVATTDSTSITITYGGQENTTIYSTVQSLAVVSNFIYYAEGSIWSWNGCKRYTHKVRIERAEQERSCWPYAHDYRR